jgi:peptide/nickel transport system substrate-binding protein
VRNPNWNPATDYRPAYLDRIEISEGGDSLAIGNSVLAGSHMVQLDTPAPTIVRRAYRSGQVHITRGAGDHYMTLDNAHGPFRNVNLRRAVWAALNRRAILRLRGGPLLGEVATHFITPGTPGFAQAGGYRGPRFAFNAHPAGDLAVARRYMRRAGYRRGRYTGPPVTFVATTAGDDPQIARIVLDALHRLGFRTRVRLVDEATVYSAWCGVPRRRIDVCTSAGWIRDFADAGTILEVPFNGRSIVPIDNSNWGLVNDPAINRAMARAERVNGSAAHARAWARVDRMLVREAVAVPFEFDNQPNIESRDVDGVGDAWNIGSWDFSFTSLR